MLFDLPARKFHIFGTDLLAAGFPVPGLLLIIAALALFFFTAAGAAACGAAMPARRRCGPRSSCGWSAGPKATAAAHAAGRGALERRTSCRARSPSTSLWLTFALWTGFTFVGFFTPIHDLAAAVRSCGWGGWETFWVLFYGLAT